MLVVRSRSTSHVPGPALVSGEGEEPVGFELGSWHSSVHRSHSTEHQPRVPLDALAWCAGPPRSPGSGPRWMWHLCAASTVPLRGLVPGSGHAVCSAPLWRMSAFRLCTVQSCCTAPPAQHTVAPRSPLSPWTAMKGQICTPPGFVRGPPPLCSAAFCSDMAQSICTAGVCVLFAPCASARCSSPFSPLPLSGARPCPVPSPPPTNMVALPGTLGFAVHSDQGDGSASGLSFPCCSWLPSILSEGGRMLTSLGPVLAPGGGTSSAFSVCGPALSDLPGCSHAESWVIRRWCPLPLINYSLVIQGSGEQLQETWAEVGCIDLGK